MGCRPHSEKKPKPIATSSGSDPDMDEVNTLLLRLDTPIERWEVPLLRGAVNSLLSCRSTLFHNHTTEGLRYSYPLVQYKRVGGKAALLCIGQGVDALGDLLSVESLDTHIGQRRVVLRIESIDALAHPVEEEDVAKVAAAPQIDGVVKHVNRDLNLVVLSVGADDGVKRGTKFEVYANNTYKGQVVVDDVYPDNCAARIVRGADAIAVMDKATTRL